MLRTLFLLLLLANLALAGWWVWDARQSEQTPSVPSVAQTAGSLRLLQELPASERTAPIVSPEPQAQVQDPRADTASSNAGTTGPLTPAEPQVLESCYRITDIGRKDQRDALASKIAALDIAVLERGEEFNERETYWVYIPPLKNSAEAQQIIAALTKAKVRDYLLVRSGENQNAISLGLFTQREGADKRLEQISALQLKAPRPLLRSRTSTYRSYWVLIKGQQNQSETLLLELLQKEKRIASGVDCPL